MVRLPYSATTCAVVHSEKNNVAGMTETRSVLRIEVELCEGCRTRRRRL